MKQIRMIMELTGTSASIRKIRRDSYYEAIHDLAGIVVGRPKALKGQIFFLATGFPLQNFDR